MLALNFKPSAFSLNKMGGYKSGAGIRQKKGNNQRFSGT